MSKRYSIRLSREALDNTSIDEIIEPSVSEDTKVETVETFNPELLQQQIDVAVQEQEEKNEIKETRQDIARLKDNVAALEDLANILGSMKEIGPFSRALTYNALNLASAGLEMDATRIVPGLESITDGQEASSSIKEKIKKLKKTIGEMISSLFMKTVDRLFPANINRFDSFD